MASHELHTPLTPLQLQLQALQRALAAREDAGVQPLAAKLDTALRQVRRLSRLVDDLLDVSRIVAGRLELHREGTDLAELTWELVERYEEQARSAGCAVRVEAHGPAHGQWDRLRVEQVLVNLLSNALKYGQGQPVEIKVTSDADAVTWRITDHGIGIAPEHRQRIFGRFERAVSARSYGGLGLGLYISHQIVQVHGGTLQVWSELGVGSTFAVTLPRGPRPAVDAARSQATRMPAHA